MKRTSFLSLGISLFCSCVLSNAAYDAARGPILASPIATQSVERGLQEMALRMGGENVKPPVAVATVAGKPVESTKPPTPPLEPLAEWLIKKGTAIAFSSNVSTKFKLTEGRKLPARQLAFADDKGTYTASVSTENGRTVLILSVESKNEKRDLYFFLTSPKGVVESTVAGPRPDVDLVANDKYADVFEKHKKFWLEKVEAEVKAQGQLAKADPAKPKS